MLAESVSFDDSPARCSLSDQPIPPGGVPRALRHAAEGSGLDPIAELYNEALRYAVEGHLKPARERLQMLLTMCPDDGEAAMLLSKVLIAGQKWQEALASLDVTESAGQIVPENLRITVQTHLRADNEADEEQRQALLARDEGEIKALRSEARRLRSENAQLLGQAHELEQETRKWAWTTAGVSSMAILFLIVNLIFGGGSADTAAVAAVPPVVDDIPVADANPAGIDAEGSAAAPEAPVASLTERAASALAASSSLEGTTLEVQLNGNTALLSGVVPTFRHRKNAEDVLLATAGIAAVEAEGVEVIARTRGAHHVVKSGDNLSKISYEFYGDATQAKNVLKANKKLLRGRTNLSLGQELVIPAID